MKPLVKEWVAKAEGDFHTAQRELRARKNPNYDAVCFHAQQCVEKYLKGRLQDADVQFGKTHNLVVLLNLLVPVDPLLEDLRQQLVLLNEYAVEARYPGETADKETAREAFAACKAARERLRGALRLRP